MDQLCFGSEEGTVEGMQLAARILNEEPQGFRDLPEKQPEAGNVLSRSQKPGSWQVSLHVTFFGRKKSVRIFGHPSLFSQ